MLEYRLFSTRRHSDGSFETPSVALTIRAPNNQAAIVQAGRHPLQLYGDVIDIAWLTDRDGAIVWSVDPSLSKAA